MDVFIKDLHVGIKNVNLTCIILDVSPRVTLKENREVRTVKVADSSACINLSLWDEPGALLHPGDIIRLTKCYAQIWRNCLTLYISKSGLIEKIGEFCMVFNETLDMSIPQPNLPVTTQSSSSSSTTSNGNGNSSNINNNGGNNNNNNSKTNNTRSNNINDREINSRYNNTNNSNSNTANENNKISNTRNTRVR